MRGYPKWHPPMEAIVFAPAVPITLLLPLVGFPSLAKGTRVEVCDDGNACIIDETA